MDYLLHHRFQVIILFVSYVDVRGWHPSYPAHSSKDIWNSGDSRGDGEYWIDPERNGNPLKVYCDMTTYGGELLSSFLNETSAKQE